MKTRNISTQHAIALSNDHAAWNAAIASLPAIKAAQAKNEKTIAAMSANVVDLLDLQVKLAVVHCVRFQDARAVSDALNLCKQYLPGRVRGEEKAQALKNVVAWCSERTGHGYRVVDGYYRPSAKIKSLTVVPLEHSAKPLTESLIEAAARKAVSKTTPVRQSPMAKIKEQVSELTKELATAHRAATAKPTLAAVVEFIESANAEDLVSIERVIKTRKAAIKKAAKTEAAKTEAA